MKSTSKPTSIHVPAPQYMPAAILAREREEWEKHLSEHPAQRNICRHCGQTPLASCIRGMIPQLIGGGGPYDYLCPRLDPKSAGYAPPHQTTPEPEPQTHELANQDNLPF